MNKVYKVVWSDAANAWVAVSEISTAHGKSKSSKTIAVAVVAVGMVLSSAAVQAAGIKWGDGAVASGNDAIAMGSLAKANARYDITIGHQAGALSGEGPNSGNSGERVTIGSHATVGSNQAIRVDAGGSLGTVNLAVKSVGQSVAIGSGTGALPENRTYAYGDQSLAIGSDTLAYGDSSVAIGGDDLDKAGAQRISYTDPTNGNRVNGTVRQAYQTLTGDTMQDGVYIKTASKQAGVSVGIQAQSGDLGVALGAKSTASTASTAIGTGASANKDNAIALGAGSKTNTNATQVTSATVGGLTYGNFAGNSSVAVGDQVSVGNTGFERQIKHVAPGEISAASTDAINGSQLYATQKTLGNVGNTVKTILGGNAAIDADGNITMSNIGGTGQNTIHDAIQAAKTKVQAADNSPVTVTGTGSSTDPYKVGVNTVTLTAPATGTDAGKVTVPTGADAGKLATAGDIANAINNSGFKATAGGNTTGATPTQELIKAGDTLTLKAGNGLTVEQSGSTFTYALNAQQITQNAQTPVVYTKADGSKVYKHTDGNFYDQPNGAGTQVAAGDVIAS
ncbi:Hep/Hag repeat protein, partial [Neisseria elongata subsp. glycolytica ATCC 29315]